jgi:hypothetical protein
MPTRKIRTRLRWSGRDTVQEILRRLPAREHMVLTLPPGFHHAVTVAAGPDSAMRLLVDVALDDAALTRLTRIRGLRELALLRDALAQTDTGLRLRTPPPRILFVPRGTARQSHMRHGMRPAGLLEPSA